MKAFVLQRDQIASIAAALVVDELGVRFDRHIDTQTGASWSAETNLFGDEGMELTAQEAAACLARLYRFFGHGAQTPANSKAVTLGDWVDGVAAAVAQQLTVFSFSAAGDEARQITHSADIVYSDAASAANLLYGRRRILSLVSPHSLIGFALSVLTPNLLQAPSIDARTMAPDDLTKFLAFGDALIATPSLWRYIIAQGVYAPDNSMAVFFGEPMTPDLSAEIRQAGFGAQREIYGSTENGLIGWRDAPSDPFALFDQWRRNGDNLRRTTPTGAGIDVTPMDMFAWDGDRRFRLGGRRDGAVQIGAVNVFPERIARKIAEHPDIGSCAVSVSRHAAGADRLVATIVLKSGGPPLETVARSIEVWCRTKLRPHERPRVYNFSAIG